MNQKTELKINIVVVFCSQVLMLIANFFTKQAILLHLNAEYMGLQTVCANFCDMLSMAYSASGMVMLFRLYKPLEEHNELKISAVFHHFKNIFRKMSAVSLLIGIILSIITMLCVKTSIPWSMVLLYFWLYLFGVLAYNLFLFNYYFLMADQKRYVAAGICGIVDAIALIFEIYALLKTKNYSLFLTLIFSKNILENGLIALYRKKNYKYLTGNTFYTEELDQEEKRGISRNIYDMIISKIGSLLLYNTDSILISAIVSTTISGYYSCYYFIVYGLQYTLTTVFDTLVPKIGQLSVREGTKSQYRNYILVSLFNILSTTVCVTGFYLICEDFIVLWVGNSALLDRRLITIIAINLYLSMTRYTSSTFRQAEGLFNKISWLILFRGIFNVFLSIVLGNRFGILGIIAATSISDGLTVFWYEPYMIHKFYEKKAYFAVIYEVLTITTVFASILTAKRITSVFTDISWLFLIVKVLITIVVSVVCVTVILGVVLIVYKANKKRIDEIIDSKNCEDTEIEPPKENTKHLKFSFILPVFNGENCIKNAINSVLEEKNTDLELIVIDDGSTDNTYSIVKEIAGTDQRLILLHIDNQGQGLARNIGIQHASGDYIAFIDADDVLLWRGMKKLTKLAMERQWDVICGNYYKKHNNHQTIGLRGVDSGIIVHSKNELYEKIKTKSVFGYCWNKLFKTSFIRENTLLFDDIRKVYMEDTLFCLKAFACNPKYYYCDIPVYCYSIANDSSSKKPDSQILDRCKNLIAAYYSYLAGKHFVKDNNDLLVPLSLRVFCWAQYKKNQIDRNKYKSAKHNISSFMHDPYFNSIITDKTNINEINRLSEFEEQLLFRTCFKLLYKQRYSVAAMLFVIFNPIFKLYSKIIK